MWRKRWCVWSFFLYFLDRMREPRLTTPPPDEEPFLWCKWLIFYFYFFADWHSIQYVSGHSCVTIQPLLDVAESHSIICSLFRDNIRYDLLRTGNVGRTTEKILERGFLDAVRIHLYNQRESDWKYHIATTSILYALSPSNKCCSAYCWCRRTGCGSSEETNNRNTNISISTRRSSSKGRSDQWRTGGW